MKLISSITFLLLLSSITAKSQTFNTISKFLTSTTFVNSSIYDNGNVGIGTTTPTYKLDVSGSIHGDAFLAGGQTMIDANTISMYYADAQLYAMNGLRCTYWDGLAVQTAFKITNTGSIDIGTLSPSPNCKLDVNGNIFTNSKIVIGTTDMVKVGTYSLAVNGDAIFKRAVVKLNANWPDYVFDGKYRLLPLTELEKFLSIKKHLPDVPSAAEITKDGIDLGNNQAILLKKIEELTLYMIEQNKKLELQNTEIKTLKKQINLLQKN